jgi:hypothetical protein
MVDFRKLTSPRARLENQRLRDAIKACESMSNTDMARELLTHSRTLIDSGAFSTDQRWSYDEWALYRVIPELALKLDPTVELRDTENPSSEEKADWVTYLRDQPAHALHSAILSIVNNCQLGRAHNKGTDARFAADVLLANRHNAFKIAAGRVFPGLYPKNEDHVEKPDLNGFFVIARDGDDHDSVMQYCDTMAEAQKYYDVAVAHFTGEDYDKSDPAWGTMFSIRMKQEFDHVSIQDWGGNAVQTTDLAAHRELASNASMPAP